MFLWLDVIRGFSQHKNIGLALRQAFSRIPNDATFNLDDMFMFFKSVLPTIIYSVRDVFKDHDIPIKTLDDFIAQVNNINNINNYASNMGAQGTFNSQVRMNQPEKRQAG